MTPTEPPETPHAGASEAQNPALSARPVLPLVLVALLVVAVAPVLRTLYPILYVIGEDWSYPGVGAVGLLGIEVGDVAIGTVPASDHLPLVATLTLTG